MAETERVLTAADGDRAVTEFMVEMLIRAHPDPERLRRVVEAALPAFAEHLLPWSETPRRTDFHVGVQAQLEVYLQAMREPGIPPA